jgi:hypothetical protein
MRAVRRVVAAVSLVSVLASGSAFAGMRDDDSRGRDARASTSSKFLHFVHRVLDYLDNKLSVPPI